MKTQQKESQVIKSNRDEDRRKQAVDQFVRILKPLPHPERIRVVATTAVFYGISPADLLQ